MTLEGGESHRRHAHRDTAVDPVGALPFGVMALEPGPMSVVHNAFTTKEEVLADLAALDLWPTTYVSERGEELPLHWHDVDNCGYVLEGHGYVLDADGERVDLGPGDKLVLPAGAVHAEGEMTESMVWIVGISEPANLMDALLPLRDPVTSPFSAR